MSRRDDLLVEPLKVTAQDLLDAWRDAVRAAELAERLAANAVKAAEDADGRAIASEELAALAEQAAEHATRTAARARATAQQAAALAKGLREEGLVDAQHTVESAHEVEAEARTAYHDAESNDRADGVAPD